MKSQSNFSLNWSGNIKASPKIIYPNNLGELKKIIEEKNFIIAGNQRSFGDNSINTNFIYNNLETKFTFVEENGEAGNENFLENSTIYKFDEKRDASYSLIVNNIRSTIASKKNAELTSIRLLSEEIYKRVLIFLSSN